MLLTTTSKVTAVKKLIREKKYDEAIEIAEKINPDKVASVYDLSVIAEAYIRTGRLEDARDLYLVMYDRNKSHKVMTGLIELNLKLRQPEQASAYLREFRKMEPDNPERLIYRYRVDTMLGKSPEYLVKSLAKLKTEEYTDVWALELAKAYYKNNDREACAAECHSILKYFPDSEVAGKAKVLLGACEVADDDAEFVETADKIAEEENVAEVAESLEKDVSQMLEEAAAAEAVANEVIDDKTMSSVTPMQPVPYLRTLEFMIQSKPAGEDRSTCTEDPVPEEEKTEETAAVAAEEIAEESAASGKDAYVLPESLRGQIDNIIYDDDDDDDDDEDELVFTGYFTEDGRIASEVEEEAAAEAAAVEAEAEEATEADEEADDEADTDDDEDESDDEDDSEDEDSDDDVEDEEEDEESDEDSDEFDEETDDESDDSEEEASDGESDDEDEESDEDEDADDESEEDEADDESDEDESDDEDDLDDDDDFEDEDSDEDESDEDEESEDDEYDDGFADEYDEYQGEDGFEEDEEDDLANTSEKLSQSEDPYVDEALDSVADKLASQILSATAEEQTLRESDAADAAEDSAKALADTRVMEASPGKSLGSVLQDDDKAIEKALYSLLEEAKSAKKD